jgi:hypothetical protein
MSTRHILLNMLETENLSNICKHHNDYPYYAFIERKIVRCDTYTLSVMELKYAFKECLNDAFPGHRCNLQKLYELITKKFGINITKYKRFNTYEQSWVGIRIQTYDYEYECEDEFQTNECKYELSEIETKCCDQIEMKTRKDWVNDYIRNENFNCIPCKHGQCNRTYCKVCDRTCEHGKCKSTCNVCVRCEHGKCNKSHCKECGGSALCRSSWCHTTGNKKYDGYCVPCFVNNPDNMFKPEMRNHKTKEKEVVDFIMENYPKFTWVADRRVQDGCSRRRPDLLLDMGSHIIIIEIDENKHSGYDCSCENKRLMEISQDLQHRPIVFIRFNPDSYRDQSGRLIKSCWQLNTHGIMTIILSKRNEWNERMQTLNQQIHHWIDNIPEKMVEIIELFY